VRSTELSIPGAWVFEPPVFPDARGTFVAPYQRGPFRAALGFELEVAQSNSTVSARGVVRGVHFADTPPGQAKYVHCARGAVLDVVVDLRVGSPTFGEHVAIELDDRSCRAVYVSEGLGHSFIALEDGAIVSYLCSTPYSPDNEHCINPLDPELALPWPAGIGRQPSEKDAAAPTLRQAGAAGLLPSWGECVDWYAKLRS
jgi:5-epimerase